MRYKKRIIIMALSLITLSACARQEIAHETRIMMDTMVSVKIPLRGQSFARQAIEESFWKMKDTQAIMNRHRPNGELWLINSLQPGEEIIVSPVMSGVLNKCIELNRLSCGAFDITVTPLVSLWSDYKKMGVCPAKEDIKAALENGGIENIDLKGSTLSMRRKKVRLDLSGIAKGYVVDEGIKALKKRGINNCLIDAGGDIYCLGSGPDNKGWRVGIRHPREDSLIGTLTLRDQAVATSGDYQRFFMVDGRRFSHIIDPRTGYPVNNNVMSATVITDDCVTADGLATALMVLGPVEGLRLAEELGGVEAITVSEGKDGLIINTTSGVTDLYESL